MTDDLYVEPSEDDPGEGRAQLQFWLRTDAGAVLFGCTIETGPFDDLRSLRTDLLSALPWSIVEPVRPLQRHVVQLTLFT